MSVKKELTRLEKSNVMLKLTVPKEDVQAQYKDLLKDFAKQAQIPGFRKGKVPQEVLERKFGEALRGESMGKIIEKAIDEVFDDESFSRDERPLAYSRPEMQEEPKLDLDQDLSFSLVYDVLPKVHIGQWKGLEIEVPEASVSEEDIGRELEELRERNSIVIDRDDDEAAQNGDVVTVDHCELGEDGGVLPDTERKDFAFTLGTKLNGYLLDDEVAGMKKGETKEFTKTYSEADTAYDPLVAGKTLKLRVTLTSLKEKRLPDLDDELAQDVDEKFQTLDDLKKSIRERLERTLEGNVRNLKVNTLLEKIMENTPVILPESMVRVELDGRMRNMARQFGTDTETLQRIFASSGKDPSEIEQTWRVSAEKALHSRLIVETIIEEQHIEASDDEIKREKELIADESGVTIEAVEKQFGEDRAKEYLKETISERKLFDLLLAENVIKTGPKAKYLDLLSKNE